MLITKIRESINMALAGEMLSMRELLPHLDYAIDQINETMNTKFPAFSDLAEGAAEYTAIPDKYIRSVIVPGAAWHFYVYDEEGIQSANQYSSIFELAKFTMLRDYSMYVPEEYRAESTGYAETDPDNIQLGDRGLITDVSNFFI